MPRMPARAVCAIALVLATAFAAAAWAAGPPTPIFKTGFNLCKLATLPAVEKAAGATLSPGTFDGKFCNWSGGGSYTVMVTTHPSAYTAMLALLGGQKGEKVSNVTVPGASRGVLDAFPYAKTHRYDSDLYAVYPQGVVQVSFNYATSFQVARLIAVMRLLTGA
jgi:hypothetical protein